MTVAGCLLNFKVVLIFRGKCSRIAGGKVANTGGAEIDVID